MGRRLTIYAGDHVDAVLDGHDNMSARIEAACERYLAMVADELDRVELTRAEWCAILDVNTGRQGPTALWANVHDAPGLDARHGVDVPTLVKRLQRLPRSTLVAIAEAVERFWCLDRASRVEKASTDADMVAAGIKPKERK